MAVGFLFAVKLDLHIGYHCKRTLERKMESNLNFMRLIHLWKLKPDEMFMIFFV